MRTANRKLIDLETKFWESMVSQDKDAALELLSEPALMIGSLGALKFDNAGYRRMFPNATTAILSYRVKQQVTPRGKEKSTVQEMHDTSTWIRTGERWQCVMHTESPVDDKRAAH